MHPRRIAVLPVALGWLLAACGGGGGAASNPSDGGGGSPTGSRLYAANCCQVGSNPYSGPQVTAYTSPFSAATTPSGNLTSGVGTAVGVAVDPTDASGEVYVSTYGTGGIAVFARPNPSGGSPLFNVSGGGIVQPLLMGFDSAGNLYFGDIGANKVFEVAKPISAASVPVALPLTTPGTPVCAAVDAAGNLYEVDYSTTPSTLRMYGSSHAGAQVAATTSGMANHSDVCSIDPVTQRIYVDNYNGTVVGYATPLTNGAAPVVTLSFPAGSGACGFGFDPSGTLYVNVTSSTTSVIDVFTQPIVSGAPGSIALAFTNNGSDSKAEQLATGP